MFLWLSRPILLAILQRHRIEESPCEVTVIDYYFDVISEGDRLLDSTGHLVLFSGSQLSILLSVLELAATIAPSYVRRSSMKSLQNVRAQISSHNDGNVLTTYTYSSDDLKRCEQVGSSITTLVWDGRDYLQGRS